MWAMHGLVAIAVELGNVEEAERLLVDVVEPLMPEERPFTIEARLTVAARRGDEAAAVALLPDVDTEESDAFVWVEAALRAGVEPVAVRARLAAAGEPDAALFAELEALLALAEGRHADVVDAVDRAFADGSLSTLYAVRRATLRVHRARALAAMSRTSEAVADVRSALHDLDRWPGWRRAEAHALLARLETAASLDGELTPREREVAALLAEGLTNADVARRLYISPKTAAVHVSNILAKLGMGSRAEVAAWAVRQGLAAERGARAGVEGA
jgi:DNA-binding NarL/FixJ family response regulator